MMAFFAAPVIERGNVRFGVPRPGILKRRLALCGYQLTRVYRGLPARRIVRRRSQTGTRVDRIERKKSGIRRTPWFPATVSRFLPFAG
jgi:hypothetical protein